MHVKTRRLEIDDHSAFCSPDGRDMFSSNPINSSAPITVIGECSSDRFQSLFYMFKYLKGILINRFFKLKGTWSSIIDLFIKFQRSWTIRERIKNKYILESNYYQYALDDV